MPALWSWGNVDLMKLHLALNSFLDAHTWTPNHTHRTPTDISIHIHFRLRSHKCTFSYFEESRQHSWRVTMSLWLTGQEECRVLWWNVTRVKCQHHLHVEVQAAKCHAVICASILESRSKTMPSLHTLNLYVMPYIAMFFCISYCC